MPKLVLLVTIVGAVNLGLIVFAVVRGDTPVDWYLAVELLFPVFAILLLFRFRFAYWALLVLLALIVAIETAPLVMALALGEFTLEMWKLVGVWALYVSLFAGLRTRTVKHWLEAPAQSPEPTPGSF